MNPDALSCSEIEFLLRYEGPGATSMATPMTWSIYDRTDASVGGRTASEEHIVVHLSDNMPAGWKSQYDPTSTAPGGLIGPYLVVIKAPAAAIS